MGEANPEQIRQYMLVLYTGLFCIYWHDWMVTLPSEYRHIWKANWSIIKVLYLITRYSPLLLSIFIFQGFRVDWTEGQCRRYFAGLANALPLLVQATVSGILMIRCYAVWNRSIYVLGFFMLLQASQSASAAWLVARYIDVVPFPDGHGPCIWLISRPTMTVGCILSLIFDLVATFLLVYRAHQIRKQDASAAKSSILTLIVRHGALYALGVGACVAANLAFGYLSMQYDTPFRGYPGSNFCTVVAASLACRLVLGLRDSEEARGWSTGNSSTTFTGGDIIYSGKSSRSRYEASPLTSASGKTRSGVQVTSQTVRAYCVDPPRTTIHLDTFSEKVDDGGSTVAVNIQDYSDVKSVEATHKKKKGTDRDLEDGKY